MHFSGALSCVCSFFKIFLAENTEAISFKDKSGETQTTMWHSDFIMFMSICKLVHSGLLFVQQGRHALSTFRDLYNDYKQGEKGTNEGIPMTSRQSKGIKSHVRQVKVITFLQIVTIFIACLLLKGELDSIGFDYVYQSYSSQGVIHSDALINLSSLWLDENSNFNYDYYTED